MQLETELYGRLRASTEIEAIRVFGDNLRDLLLAAPAGTRASMGIDPGLRTGVKWWCWTKPASILNTQRFIRTR